MSSSPVDSLYGICCLVVVANIERYSPRSFAVCSEDDWDFIVEMRHAKTTPSVGVGGLDGTGRLAPAISEKKISLIETSNPHLANSAVASTLIWKDCVEYRFRFGGLTRPRALLLPWPALVQDIQAKVQVLKEDPIQDDDDSSKAGNDLLHEQHRAVARLWNDIPMSVGLLQASGVGIVVRKALKAQKRANNCILVDKLRGLLNAWKQLASMDTTKHRETDALTSDGEKEVAKLLARLREEEDDMALAQTCDDWRQLFRVLKGREETRRSSQGKRMREIRKNLASGRPKVVKVRPATKLSPRQERLAAVVPGANKKRPVQHGIAGGGNVKMLKIRHEASLLTSHRRHAPQQSSQLIRNQSRSTGASFGDAVAFVSGSTKKKPPPSKSVVKHVGNKIMTIPVRKGKQTQQSTSRSRLLRR